MYQTLKLSKVVWIVLVAAANGSTASLAQVSFQPISDYKVVELARLDEPAATDPVPEGNTELVRERYADGNVKTERQVSLNADGDFVNHGLYRSLDREGRTLGLGHYRMGKRDGQWERILQHNEGNVFSDNAARGFAPPFKSVASFDNDQVHGDWTIVDSKGRIMIQWHFEHGKREGAWIWFNPDATIRKQITYHDGCVAGDIVASDGKDKLKVIQQYLEGRALVPLVAWHSRGRKKSEGYVLKPREVTSVSVDWWKANVQTNVVRTEEKEDRHGQWQFWYSNGRLSKKGTFDRGARVGMFTWWHPNGQKKAEGIYLDDQPHGQWQTWYATGGRKSFGKYDRGVRVGRWLTWHENGMRQFEGDYDRGELTAEARIWDNKGQQLQPGDEQSPQDETITAKVNAGRVRLSKQPLEMPR